ncbi:Tryptophan--tRNA ligase, cytoplasmic [Histomonas meleagridis]|uniref:Tryptophan--tRNA ligase, cytoplasmic n=1 Tax=Histomonas meleagridis TaxID=135588 RepID=UPI003559FB79|nr:Tryptophan--tRNA ligase, cytoplasmic [Histomonas meleagridis]KAH0805298.1 Tryptophan--tRNA ligase, cytoplasmic [Histomonas meleagridis]
MAANTKLADATDGAAQMTEERLIEEFGCGALDDAILQRWEKVTGVRPHKFMRRGLFFAHRELTQILDAKEQGKTIYLYTGRGPSSDALHLGHLVPFIFNKYLQDALDCFLIVQVTDDEKFIRDKDLSWDTIQKYTESNIRDILAQGFNPEKTFIMRESKYFDINVPFLTEMSRCMSLHVIQSLFGFVDEHSVGYVVFPAKQIAPAFAQYFVKLFTHPNDVYCLIPCGREQDPYFRYAREIAKRLKTKRVSTIYGKFIPALGGGAKMTASKNDSAIYIQDSDEEIARKINECAHTDWTPEGANLKEDVVYQYLSVFDDDDEYLAEVERRYGKGELKEGEERMTPQELKERLIKVLQKLVSDHKKGREQITDDVVEKFESLKVWN